MKRKILKSIVTAFTILSILPAHVFAGNDWRKSDWKIDDVKQYIMNNDYEYSNYIRMGGVNSIDEVQAESREETEQLEEHLKANGYILVNTKDRQISEEEFEFMKKVFQNIVIGDDMLEDDKHYYSDNQKLYLNKDVYEVCLKQAKENDDINEIKPQSILELATSAVFIDYLVWNSMDNVGRTYTNEFINDNLKKYDEKYGTEYDKNAGYIYIITDMDSRIIFSEQYSKTFQQIDVVADVPTLVKMRNGYYKIDTINDVSIEDDESLLGNYNNNIFKLNNGFTAEKPVIIDLTKGVNEKYGIEPYNIEGDIDFRANEWVDIDPDEYQVTVEEGDNLQLNGNIQTNSLTVTSKIVLGVIGFVLIVVGLKKVLVFEKKKESKE